MSPQISVCLPVWNGGSYLKEAIESVLRQENADFELIISDDQSIDRSHEIISQYQGDARVRVVRQSKRLGLFANYNFCISLCRAPLVKFFAQDDLLLPGALASIVELFANHPDITLLSTAKLVIDGGGQAVNDQLIALPGDYLPVVTDGIYKGFQVVEAILNTGVNFIGEPCAVTIRKEAVGDGFDPDFAHVGDLDYWIRVLLQGSYMFLEKPLCSFRQHPGSATRANLRGMKYATDLLKLYRKHRDNSENLNINLPRQRSELLSSLASHTYLLNEACEVNLAVVKGQAELESLSRDAAKEELLLTRELLFNALVQLGAAENRFSWKQKEFAEVFTREREIAAMEAQVRCLLSSRRWHVTRGLRDLRARIFGINPTELHFSPPVAVPGETLAAINERQKLYLAYLTKLRDDIVNSRSWRITAPLRFIDPISI